MRRPETGDGQRLSVLLPAPLPGPLDYRNEGPPLAPGDYVLAPLGPRRLRGVVWAVKESDGKQAIPYGRLKAVLSRAALPPMPEAERRLIDWTAAYTLSPPGMVLKMALSALDAFEDEAAIQAYALGGPLPERITPARRRILDLLAGGPPRTVADIAETAGVSEAAVRGLIAAGALIGVSLSRVAVSPRPDLGRAGPALSESQARAADALKGAVAEGGYRALVLDGVTGAGKTEVYFEAIAEALKREESAQALVLVPEIALTEQWLERFAARFGALPHAWHSELGKAERRRTWRAVAKGEARVVVGARSALFLPFSDLKLIVVDEEHDPSYKQEDGVLYNARDMAVVRGSIGKIPVVLTSATPSIESVVNVRDGRYGLVHLADRHGGASLPEISAIDMRVQPPDRGRWLSPPLASALAATVADGEQALLFLNRRGYAPLTLCRRCGHRLQCPNCTAWLVEHRHKGRVECHHCGFFLAAPESCPACGEADSLVACGPGVERLAEEVALRLPEARVGVMASDTVTGPKALASMIRRVAAHEIDIVIGTQLVAKGHHFPMLTLVGVVDADLGLGGGDLRAAERTYQQLQQVSGRAGRAERPGRVLLQSFMPDHPVMAALISGDREAFLEREIAARRDHGMPPFGRLVALIVSGEELAAVVESAKALARRAPADPGVAVLGPAPAPLALLRGRHRYRLLLKARKDIAVQSVVRAWLARVRLAAGVRVQADVDPYSFM